MADDIGPQLPPQLLKAQNPQSDMGNKTDGDHKVRPNTDSRFGDGDGHIFGPALPPSMPKSRPTENEDTNNRGSIGPALPPGWDRPQEREEENEDDDDFVGPLPGGANSCDEKASKRFEIEARSIAMKDKLSGKSIEAAPKREQWMTELPPELGANIGIVARTFKKKTLNSKEADRSVWTETPADRERKLKEGIEKKEKKEAPAPSRKDLEMINKIEEHNKQHRSSSLMELHQEDRKKKKTEAPTERRSFDRNQDLDLKKFDKKATSTFIKRSKNLNSKFENSRFDSKFL